jgi:hypothetical protein
LANSGKRDQAAANIGNIVLGFIAHIEQKEIFAGIQPTLQFFNSDFRNSHCFLPVWNLLGALLDCRVASISTENRKPTCQFDFWRWVINEGPACKLLYPSHFLTPEDAHAQQIAAQQHISAVMAVEFLTALKVPHGSEFGKITRRKQQIVWLRDANTCLRHRQAPT